MVGTENVIVKDDIRDVAQNRDDDLRFFRQAFRSIDWPENTGSLTFPDIEEADDIDEEEIEEVAEGDPYPTSSFSYSGQTLYKNKYGVTLEFTDEALADTPMQVVMDGKMSALEAEAKKVDGVAYGVLAGAAASSGQGNADDDLTMAELIDARAWHKSSAGGRYDPDLAFVESMGGASLLKEMANRDTADGDEAARTGKIGDVAGMDVIEANTGLLAPHEAIIADTDELGWGASQYEKRVERERDSREDTTYMTVKDRLNFIATDGAAAATVEG